MDGRMDGRERNEGRRTKTQRQNQREAWVKDRTRCCTGRGSHTCSAGINVGGRAVSHCTAARNIATHDTAQAGLQLRQSLHLSVYATEVLRGFLQLITHPGCGSTPCLP
jgi:hypothetical protein